MRGWEYCFKCFHPLKASSVLLPLVLAGPPRAAVAEAPAARPLEKHGADSLLHNRRQSLIHVKGQSWWLNEWQDASCCLRLNALATVEKNWKTDLADCTSRQAVFVWALQCCAIDLVTRFIKTYVLGSSKPMGQTDGIACTIPGHARTFDMLFNFWKVLAGSSKA